MCFGQLISSIVAFTLDQRWRLAVGIAGVPAFIQCIVMLYMPETQKWLAKRGKTEKMQLVLERIYNYESIQIQKEVL